MGRRKYKVSKGMPAVPVDLLGGRACVLFSFIHTRAHIYLFILLANAVPTVYSPRLSPVVQIPVPNAATSGWVDVAEWQFGTAARTEAWNLEALDNCPLLCLSLKEQA